MKNFVKFLSAAAVVAVLLTGCEKEQAAAPESNGVITSGINPNTEASADDLLRVDRTIENTTKKGYIMDESFLVDINLLTMGVATDAANNTYQTLKIPRPDGTYFYIMIENFRYNDGQYGSWAYEDNSSNVAKYGRMYFWEKAVALGNRVYMNIPSGFPGAPAIRISGKLPTIDHLKLLLNKPSIPNLPSTSTGIDSYQVGLRNGVIKEAYFDVFTFGLSLTEAEGGFHTLGGRRENPDYGSANTTYTSINKRAYLWTRDGDPDSHYPLVIRYETSNSSFYNYSAYINAQHANHFGYSVRYVFDPFE